MSLCRSLTTQPKLRTVCSQFTADIQLCSPLCRTIYSSCEHQSASSPHIKTHLPVGYCKCIFSINAHSSSLAVCPEYRQRKDPHEPSARYRLTQMCCYHYYCYCYYSLLLLLLLLLLSSLLLLWHSVYLLNIKHENSWEHVSDCRLDANDS